MVFEFKFMDDIGFVGFNGFGGNEEFSGNFFIGVV